MNYLFRTCVRRQSPSVRSRDWVWSKESSKQQKQQPLINQ
jgi:hypothetical protein